MRHEPLREINGRFFYGVDGELVEVSTVTTYCLSCHDGTEGPARQGPSFDEPGNKMLCEGLPGLHPVEVLYPVDDRGYRATEELPAAIIMTEGRITCVSCHRLDSETHELVVKNRRSALCLTCHRK